MLLMTANDKDTTDPTHLTPEQDIALNRLLDAHEKRKKTACPKTGRPTCQNVMDEWNAALQEAKKLGLRGLPGSP
jgi:hypothetical protein